MHCAELELCVYIVHNCNYVYVLYSVGTMCIHCVVLELCICIVKCWNYVYAMHSVEMGVGDNYHCDFIVELGLIISLKL